MCKGVNPLGGRSKGECPSKGRVGANGKALLLCNVIYNGIVLDSSSEFHAMSSTEVLDDGALDKSDLTTTVSGHARGRSITVDEYGSVDGIKVLYSNKFECNVISEKLIESDGELYPVKGWGTRVVLHNGQVWDFILHGK